MMQIVRGLSLRRHDGRKRLSAIVVLLVLLGAEYFIILLVPGSILSAFQQQQQQPEDSEADLSPATKDKLRSLHRRLLERQNGGDDGSTFLGHSVRYQPSPRPDHHPLQSTVHCVGDNFRSDAWLYRSCQYRNLCFDAATQEFLLFPSPEELAVMELLQQFDRPGLVTISSIANDKELSLGSIQDPWSDRNTKWMPKLVTSPEQQKERLAQGYYELAPNSILFPIQLSSTELLLWNDIFAIYTVLSIFGMEDKKIVLFPVQQTEAASQLLVRLGPALGVVTHVHGSSATKLKQSQLVCAPYGAAGLGMIASTRQRTKATDAESQILTHAVSRGAVYRDFRKFLLNHMELGDFSEPSPDAVGIAIDSKGTQEQVMATLRSLGEFQIQSSTDENTESLDQQVTVAVTSKIFVAEMANPSATFIAATFLPEGAVLFVLDNDDKVEGNGVSERQQLRDLLDVMGHIRLHWLSSVDGIAPILRKESIRIGQVLS